MVSHLSQCLEIQELPRPARAYSICTLVTDRKEYEAFVDSCVEKGFTLEDCEFLYADNTAGNRYDAYAAYNAFLLGARGAYLILCHQDILMAYDDRAKLDRVIAEMNALDPNWAVLGNAGGLENSELRLRISDPHGENRGLGPLPAKAQTLDENFLLLRRSANLGFSRDLTGFHFYGADICLVAELLGHSSYVVDFHLRHLSGGKLNLHFADARTQIAEKYSAALRPRWVRTTCTAFFITGNRWVSRLLNANFGLRWIRRYPAEIRRATRWLGLC